MAPKPAEKAADLIVIGAGPGGYAAAFRAADLGREVTLIDPRAALGGVCLNEGCIPSKALLHAAEVMRSAKELQDWGITFKDPRIDLNALRAKKDAIVSGLTGGLAQLATRRKVTVVRGTAHFTGTSEVLVTKGKTKQALRFADAIVAVGSSPIRLPGWPDDPRIMDSTAALALKSIPKRLAIVGGGIIGLEMATVYSALGSSVTIVELAPHLVDGVDADALRILTAALKAHGCTIHVDTRVEKVEAGATALTLHCTGSHADPIAVDAIIQAVGRRANGLEIGAEAAGIAVSKSGVISVDATCKTNVDHILAVGDVTGAPMLAHRATHQGKVAAEVASGHAAGFDTAIIPAVAYTDPELAWAGLTEKQARDGGVAHKVSKFPWAASGRNLASGGGGGMTKIIWNPDGGHVLGATIIGRHAGELIAEMVLAIEMGATLEDIALSVHAHPTLSETSGFVAELALGICTDL